MAQERKANNAQSSIMTTISSGDSTLTVASATPFPTVPQFRMLLEQELVLVTALAGDVFSITRGIEGTVAVGHGGGTTVTLIETEAGQVRFQRDWSNPLWGVGVPMQLLDSAGATLTASSFTDINFSTASKADVTGGAIVLEKNTQGSGGDRASIVKSVPSVPWTVTTGFIANLHNESGDFPPCGQAVRDNTTGEIYQIRLVVFDTGTALQVATYTTTSSSAVLKRASTTWIGGSGIVWTQIEDDNTDLIFRVSTDGVNYLELFKEPRLTFLTPDQVGFVIDNDGVANVKAMATLVSWDES